MKLVFCILCVSLVILSCSMNTNPIKRVNVDTLISLADVTFLNKINDFGVVPQDTILIAKYYLRNIGEDTLLINKVSPDCSCTSYFLSKNKVAPNDTASISLVFNTKDKYGEEKIYTIVVANTPTKMYKLTLKANIH